MNLGVLGPVRVNLYPSVAAIYLIMTTLCMREGIETDQHSIIYLLGFVSRDNLARCYSAGCGS